MGHAIFRKVPRSVVLMVAALVLTFSTVAPSSSAAQRGRGTAPPSPQSPRQAALVDLTGYWVSVVTEDWRFRMLAAPKGHYQGVPLNAEGRKVADAWDPVKDQASDTLCKAYGAAGIMRIPGRLHITWQDDNTLKIDTDAGRQTRLLHFGGAPPPAQPQWQGYSVASWQREGPRGGTLKVMTTSMRPGYLRKNGVPYSEKAVLTEYFDRWAGPNGDQWFSVTTIVSDPTYLTREFITSTDFKKEPNEAKWNPTPCEMPLRAGL